MSGIKDIADALVRMSPREVEILRHASQFNEPACEKVKYPKSVSNPKYYGEHRRRRK
jgi:hypothetical protein